MNIKISKIIFFIVLFCSATTIGQIQKMSDLSQNKYLGMHVIMNNDREDVWGYAALYQKDKVSKDFLELELVILDQNLNKIGSSDFQQYYFNSWIIDLYPEIRSLNLQDNKLYFSIGLEGLVDSVPAFYRNLDLNDFKISAPDVLYNGEKIAFVDQKPFEKLIMTMKVFPLGNKGYISFNFRGELVHKGDLYRNTNEFVIYDNDLNKKWSHVYEKNKKQPVSYSFSKIYKNFIVFGKTQKIKKENILTYEVYDFNTGDLIMSLENRKDDNYLYDNQFFRVTDSTFITYDFIYKKNKKVEKDPEKIIGFSEREYSLTNNTLITQKIFKWEVFKKYFPIDEYGKINKKFYIHPLTIKEVSNGNKIMIFEGFKPASNTQILDLYTVEFDKDYNLIELIKIDKFKNKWKKLKAYGSYLQTYGYFDYNYSQELKPDTYLFTYTDYETAKMNSYNSKLDKWVLGIITYADGKFSQQKLSLNTQNSDLSYEAARKGYILLKEYNKKQKTTELRLEKINY